MQDGYYFFPRYKIYLFILIWFLILLRFIPSLWIIETLSFSYTKYYFENNNYIMEFLWDDKVVIKFIEFRIIEEWIGYDF